jgi:hypothetical protein
MVKKTFVLIHRADYDYEVVVGCFTSKRDLYSGWKNYLKEYTLIEKREAIERLKLNLGKETRSQEDIEQIKHDREILDRIDNGSFLCYDQAKTLFYAHLVPKNSIRFDREPFELDELFFDDPICPHCMNLEYQASKSTFSMEHKKPDEDILSNKEDSQPLLQQSRIFKWGKWALDWFVWLLGFPSLR